MCSGFPGTTGGPFPNQAATRILRREMIGNFLGGFSDCFETERRTLMLPSKRKSRLPDSLLPKSARFWRRGSLWRWDWNGRRHERQGGKGASRGNGKESGR